MQEDTKQNQYDAKQKQHDAKQKQHDAIHKSLFQTLFPYAIQAMYPKLHELLDYSDIHFLQEEYQIPTTSSYFERDRRYIDILAEVKLKSPIKTHLTIELSEDQKEKIDEDIILSHFSDVLKPTQSKSPKSSKPTQEKLLYTKDFEDTDIRSQQILIHIELERTSNLIEMSQRMREYFNVISQESSWTTVIPFVVFFHN